MGAVYLAFDSTLEIQVALKENLNPNPEAERQFRREASLLATLRHPHLPRVTDHFILDERQYLVMDFIEGVDLETQCKSQLPDVEDVMDWADKLCDALIYLHSRQPPVIHRDIKPANIKLQPDGNIILVDFGIAKVFDEKQTATGARGLTPGYSPPEQYGSAHTDHRSDQFALAATLYDLLTGQRPSDSIDRLFNKEELQPITELNPLVPAAFADAITRALSLDPSERFPDVANFRSAIRGESQTVRVEDIASLQATVMSQATVIRDLPSKELPETAPPVEKPRRNRWLWIGLAAAAVVLLGGAAVMAAALTTDGFGLLSNETATTTAPVVAALPTETPSPTTTPLPVATQAPMQTAMPEPTDQPTQTPTASPTANVRGGASAIVFSSNRGEDGYLQIWTMDPDGSNPRQLTFGPGDKIQPRWSPDGERLAFVSNQEGNQDIFIMNADGTNLVNITNHPADDIDPSWAPTGDRLAFTSTRVADLRQVFTASLECPDLDSPCSLQNERNFSVGYAVEYSPAWSPEGCEVPGWMPPDEPIVVAASINGAPGRPIFRSSIGGKPEWLDLQDRFIGVDHLDWSPDGKFLLFTWKQPGIFEIYTVPIDQRGNARSKLTNSLGNREPRFSPDGNWIVFTSTRDQNPEIYLMTVSGANQTNLTNNPSQDMYPDWRPAP